MTAIVRVESGGNPLVIHDNTLNRTFTPHDANQGVVWANQLLTLRHSIDLGISQINDLNLPRLGLSVRDAFDPCINLRGGATILFSDYRAAALEFGQGQYALRRAIGAYNSGSLYAGYGYVAKILAAAGLGADNDFRVPDLQSENFPATYPAPFAIRAVPARGSALSPRHAAVQNHFALINPYSAPILVGPGSQPPARPSAAPSANPSAAPNAALPPVVLSPERAPILATPATPIPLPVVSAVPTARATTR